MTEITGDPGDPFWSSALDHIAKCEPRPIGSAPGCALQSGIEGSKVQALEPITARSDQKPDDSGTKVQYIDSYIAARQRSFRSSSVVNTKSIVSVSSNVFAYD